MKEKYGPELTLTCIPSEEWMSFKRLGFDFIWLMGVWKTSMRGAEIMASLPDLQAEYDKALPGWSESDVIGSPYAIVSYELNPELGASGDLKKVREALNDLGLGLILDFVPNHLAVDHTWTVLHPEYFIQGDREDAQKNPGLFAIVKNSDRHYLLAHGRDPFFPPWPDTVQLNFFNMHVRSAMIKILKNIAEECDGLRCDMAMLVLNDIFQKTWGWLVERMGLERPSHEFWSQSIAIIKSLHPDFIFIAEVYWDLNRKLMQLGFDYTYDKLLYDNLLSGGTKDLYSYLEAESDYQRRCVRFIENHDERRAIEAFGKKRSKAAAAVISTLVGLRLFHDGQIEGRTIKMPIQLARVQSEPDDPDIVEYYQKLLGFADSPILHEGEWTLLDSRCTSNEDCTHKNLLAWMWRLGDLSKIVIVNYSDSASQGFILLPIELARQEIVLLDELNGDICKLAEDVTSNQGLHVCMEPYQTDLLTVCYRTND